MAHVLFCTCRDLQLVQHPRSQRSHNKNYFSGTCILGSLVLGFWLDERIVKNDPEKILKPNDGAYDGCSTLPPLSPDRMMLLGDAFRRFPLFSVGFRQLVSFPVGFRQFPLFSVVFRRFSVWSIFFTKMFSVIFRRVPSFSVGFRQLVSFPVDFRQFPSFSVVFHLVRFVD